MEFSLLSISNSEDRNDLSHSRVPAFGLSPPFAGEARASSLVPSSAFLLTRKGQAQQAPPSAAPPRSPDDGPACRLASPASSAGGPAPAPVRGFREVTSRRGAPKRVNTQGYACPNQQCLSFGNTDAHIHALVGDGKHGQAERIQTFRGPACRTTFTSRRTTALYRLKTSSHQIAMVLSAAFRRAGRFRRRTRLRLPSGHHHEVAHSGRQAR
jgi:hypothetical protein